MGRVKDKVVCVPIVYGSIAFYLGKKATESETHEWSIYVRGMEDEDLSYLIKRVVFTLHPSCQIPVVTCESPPYVVTQTGWGEFECKITIVFRDENESSVDILHFLRLYPPGTSSSNTVLMKKPVVYEHYEEVLFREPEEEFYKILLQPIANKTDRKKTTNNASITNESGEEQIFSIKEEDPEKANPTEIPKGVSPEVLRPHFTKISEVESMKSILSAQTFVSQEIEKACQELAAVQESIASIKAARQSKSESASTTPVSSTPATSDLPPPSKKARQQ